LEFLLENVELAPWLTDRTLGCGIAVNSHELKFCGVWWVCCV